MTDQYWGSPVWQEHVDSAEENYESTIYQDGATVIVEATSDTMTRYTIIAVRIGRGHGVGASSVVSVLHPWGTVYPADGPGLDMGYVVSKWKPADRSYDTIHGGDAKCVTMAINEAMRRLGAH